MKHICIVRAKRTPQGRFMGALANYTALQLATTAARATLDGIDPRVVDLTILGRVLPPDFNTARALARTVGLRHEAPAFTVNMACASGLKAALLGADAIQLGQASVVLAGGVESMSNTPHGLERSRFGVKFGDAKLVDYLQVGLSDTILNISMGQTAENLARQYRVERGSQDEFAYQSHRKAAAAQKAGLLSTEIAPLPELDRDEHVRADTTVEKLTTLKPAFAPGSPPGSPPGSSIGTVTPGNASGVNDGAAMVLLCDEETARKHGWRPMAFLGAAAQVGCEPEIMGIGAARAIARLCASSGQKISDFDTIEINEAFAAQTLACLRELGLPDDEPRLNPEGGAIALGHPIGASGARLLVHLAHRVAAGRSKNALASLCVGGGMGVAAAVTA